MTLKITVRCVACKHQMDVGTEQRTIPFCPKCSSVMVAVKAKAS